MSIDDVSTGDEFQYLTPLHDTTFAKSNVDGDANKITFSASPGFNVGDRVTYDNGGGQSIGGLDHGTDYFVIPDTFDDKVLQLATTREGAFDSDAIDLDTSEGDGNAHSLQAEFDSSGLIGDEKYFALKLDNKTIQLSTTKPNEQALESDKTKWADGTRSLTAASDNSKMIIGMQMETGTAIKTAINGQVVQGFTTSGMTVGNRLYLHTNGGISETAPTTNEVIQIGYVLSVAADFAGRVYVDIKHIMSN